jgi:hypothetical protein
MSMKELFRKIASPFASAVTMYVMIRVQIKDQLIKDYKNRLEQEKNEIEQKAVNQPEVREQVELVEKKYAVRIETLEAEKIQLKDKLNFFKKERSS